MDDERGVDAGGGGGPAEAGALVSGVGEQGPGRDCDLLAALPYLQLVLGYSPLLAAAALLPMAVVVIPLSRAAPRIAAHVGVRLTGPLGLGLMATGFVVLSTLGTSSSYWHFLAGLLPFGAGRLARDNRNRRLAAA